MADPDSQRIESERCIDAYWRWVLNHIESDGERTSNITRVVLFYYHLDESGRQWFRSQWHAPIPSLETSASQYRAFACIHQVLAAYRCRVLSVSTSQAGRPQEEQEQQQQRQQQEQQQVVTAASAISSASQTNSLLLDGIAIDPRLGVAAMFGIMDRLDTNARLSDQDKLGNLKLAWQQLKLLLAHHDPRGVLPIICNLELADSYHQACCLIRSLVLTSRAPQSGSILVDLQDSTPTHPEVEAMRRQQQQQEVDGTASTWSLAPGSPPSQSFQDNSVQDVERYDPTLESIDLQSEDGGRLSCDSAESASSPLELDSFAHDSDDDNDSIPRELHSDDQPASMQHLDLDHNHHHHHDEQEESEDDEHLADSSKTVRRSRRKRKGKGAYRQKLQAFKMPRRQDGSGRFAKRSPLPNTDSIQQTTDDPSTTP